MADTVGSLVDKLCVTNIKLWFVQDEVHQAADAGDGLSPETVSKLAALNLQRNELMSELDVLLNNSIRAGKAKVDPRIKIV